MKILEDATEERKEGGGERLLRMERMSLEDKDEAFRESG